MDFPEVFRELKKRESGANGAAASWFSAPPVSTFGRRFRYTHIYNKHNIFFFYFGICYIRRKASVPFDRVPEKKVAPRLITKTMGACPLLKIATRNVKRAMRRLKAVTATARVSLTKVKKTFLPHLPPPRRRRGAGCFQGSRFFRRLLLPLLRSSLLPLLFPQSHEAHLPPLHLRNPTRRRVAVAVAHPRG